MKRERASGECRYCGKIVPGRNICGKCSEKLRLVRHLLALAQEIKRESESNATY